MSEQLSPYAKLPSVLKSSGRWINWELKNTKSKANGKVPVDGTKPAPQWQIDASHMTPVSGTQHEAHVSLGVELENQLAPYRNGWQFALRFAVAPHETLVGSTCRGAGCTVSTDGGGLDKLVFLEWMFVLGH